MFENIIVFCENNELMLFLRCIKNLIFNDFVNVVIDEFNILRKLRVLIRFDNNINKET